MDVKSSPTYPKEIAMMTEKDIVLEILEKYGEWIEMEGGTTPRLMINILSKMLLESRKLNTLYKKQLDIKEIVQDNTNT